MGSAGNNGGQTRRQWIAFAGAATVASAQTIQNTPPPIPDRAPIASTPEAMMQKAEADVREAGQKLAAIEVPISIEPAFLFRT
ncbi:MAG: hypothetical protein WA324_26630 [Bryobacteraceae bacterium]